mmetsp:Transcript_7801/g.13461  ORF Transcript_7801/g.13461 Transcript_7801/m.13461 type:complete len:195 (+) Transcript_7801:433-1017(+)
MANTRNSIQIQDGVAVVPATLTTKLATEKTAATTFQTVSLIGHGCIATANIWFVTSRVIVDVLPPMVAISLPIQSYCHSVPANSVAQILANGGSMTGSPCTRATNSVIPLASPKRDPSAAPTAASLVCDRQPTLDKKRFYTHPSLRAIHKALGRCPKILATGVQDFVFCVSFQNNSLALNQFYIHRNPFFSRCN